MFRRLLPIAALLLPPCLFASNACPISDEAATAALSKDLAKYKGVTVHIDDCIAHIDGQVERLSDAWDIEKKLRKHDWLAGVTNYLTVVGPMVDDYTLRSKIAHELNWEGNTEIWSPLAVGVNRGVVSLHGVVRDSMMLDSVLYTVGSTKGVREIVSQVQIEPLLNISNVVEWTPRVFIYGVSYVGPMDPDVWYPRGR